MKTRHIALALFIALIPLTILAQSAGVTESMLLNPPPDSWPTHHGDYSARRFSKLKVINDTNVQNLSLDWEDRKSTRLNSSHPSISYAVFCLKKKNSTP